MGIAQMQDTFQSTPLMRGETAGRGDQKPDEQISTRSPHARGDPRPLPASEDDYNFNPLPSHEGRLWASTLTRRCGNFNPLPSYEGRPCMSSRMCPTRHFNPLPSHEGRPNRTGDIGRIPRHFNPLPSHEGRPNQITVICGCNTFQFTPLSRGETRRFKAHAKDFDISIHSPHTRGDSM